MVYLMRCCVFFGVILHTLFQMGCGKFDTNSQAGRSVLRLAVTTSTRDSGLLDVLVPVFEQQRKVRVDVIANGTGAALKLGQTGDVDVVWVHARQAEDAFMADEHGIRHENVMYNTFDILGPPQDPAEIRGVEPSLALQKIAAGEHPFVSRGDDSGTHKRELQLWNDVSNRKSWDTYFESGQGMGWTLNMADQKNAYILCDHATYLTFKRKINLVPLVTSSKQLHNLYGIMIVNPHKHPSVNFELAQAFVEFLISRKTQEMMQDYTIEGEQLFYPLRLPEGD